MSKGIYMYSKSGICWFLSKFFKCHLAIFKGL